MTRYIQHLILFLLLSVFTSFSYAEYTLGAGDYLRVTVYGDADLTRETRVSEDGVLTLPLIGEVQVGGLSTIETEKRIAAQLKKGGFIANPQVSVLVLEFMSKSVSILGGVLKPGRYPITRPSDVKDLIAEAGGVTPDGSEVITVVDGDKRSEYDLHEIIHQQVKSSDIILKGGEAIYVGMRDVAIVGQVARPGKFGIQGGLRKLSDFIAQAGGATEAAGETLFYTSNASGTPVTEEVNIDQLFRAPASEMNKKVNPGDVIYVPLAPQVYVYGEVQRPGMYKIDKHMTIMQAIAKAGGLSVRGTQRSVKLHRKNAAGEVTKLKPELTDSLQDEDVLYVEESLL